MCNGSEMPDRKKKKSLHNSQMEQLARCPYRFYRKFIAGDHEPTSYPLALGISTHDSTAKAMNLMAGESPPITLPSGQKAHRLKPITADIVQDVAVAAARASWSKGVALDEAQAAQGERAIQGQLEAETAMLSSAYLGQVAAGLTIPIMESTDSLGIEWPWVVEIPGWPFDLSGRIDLICLSRGGAGLSVRDTKTSGKSPSLTMARDSHQLSMYALAMQVLTGKMPRSLFLDYVIRPGKRVGARVKTLETRRNSATNEAMKLRIQTAMDTIERGAFPPCNPGEWWCDPRYCGFHLDQTCPYVRGWAQIPVFTPADTKEKTHGEAQPAGKGKGKLRGPETGALFNDTL